ncbi:hypothetical protein AVEN_180728-1 [Araneus ventricosus]|uniref:Uncharacterized protein n=1 Tax=Araneus ventricosus TaxID=182803 RepID=A0A4Y2G1W4_ARAVE|nr:hypothetical protein AVEN_180728-1 [Araneus ventricosus]
MEHEHGCGRRLKDMSHSRRHSPKPKGEILFDDETIVHLEAYPLVGGLLVCVGFDFSFLQTFLKLTLLASKNGTLADSSTERLKLSR